jgi:hypothetical protein
VKNEDDEYGVMIGPGTVCYSELVAKDPLDKESPPAQYVKGIFPTINGVRIDNDPKPMLLVGDKTNAAIWLICRSSYCRSGSELDDSGDSERIEITDRYVNPIIHAGKIAVLIAEFEIITTGEGIDARKSVSELYLYLQSDHHQPYQCNEYAEESVIDSFESVPFDTDSDGIPDSIDLDIDGDSLNNSIDSDDDGDGTPDSQDDTPDGEGGKCGIKMYARWVNPVSCFPAKSSSISSSSSTLCNPSPFTFDIQIKYVLNDPFKNRCEGWAFKACFPGGRVNGNAMKGDPSCAVWRTDTLKTISVTYDDPPDCSILGITGLAKSFSRAGTGSDEDCCDKIYDLECQLRYGDGNPVKALPHVCYCSCSATP